MRATFQNRKYLMSLPLGVLTRFGCKIDMALSSSRTSFRSYVSVPVRVSSMCKPFSDTECLYPDLSWRHRRRDTCRTHGSASKIDTPLWHCTEKPVLPRPSSLRAKSIIKVEPICKSSPQTADGLAPASAWRTMQEREAGRSIEAEGPRKHEAFWFLGQSPIRPPQPPPLPCR